jgi:hypothetical protein
MTHSLEMQIAEVRREIQCRRHVYPALVRKRSMRQSIADMQIAIMESVLATLEQHKRDNERGRDQ